MDEANVAGTGAASMTATRPSVGRRLASRQVPGFILSEVIYPARARVPRHTHAVPGLAVVLAGGYRKRMHRRDFDCRPGVLTFEPVGFEHAESYGNVAVHALLIEGVGSRLKGEATRGAMCEPICTIHGAVGALGRRACRELAATDSAAALVLESVALELSAIAIRSAGSSRAAPPWLARVRSRIRDEFQCSLSVGVLALEAGVHPAHLARVFRAFERMSMGEYVRRCRIEWAAGQLETTRSSLAVIALAAGFCDQSHFSRVFVRVMGTSPRRYRETRAR